MILILALCGSKLDVETPPPPTSAVDVFAPGMWPVAFTLVVISITLPVITCASEHISTFFFFFTPYLQAGCGITKSNWLENHISPPPPTFLPLLQFSFSEYMHQTSFWDTKGIHTAQYGSLLVWVEWSSKETEGPFIIWRQVVGYCVAQKPFWCHSGPLPTKIPLHFNRWSFFQIKSFQLQFTLFTVPSTRQEWCFRTKASAEATLDFHPSLPLPCASLRKLTCVMEVTLRLRARGVCLWKVNERIQGFRFWRGDLKILGLNLECWNSNFLSKEFGAGPRQRKSLVAMTPIELLLWRRGSNQKHFHPKLPPF